MSLVVVINCPGRNYHLVITTDDVEYYRTVPFDKSISHCS